MSVERIYQYVWKDKRWGGDLHTASDTEGDSTGGAARRRIRVNPAVRLGAKVAKKEPTFKGAPARRQPISS